MITSALKQASEQTKRSFEQFLIQKQMSEEFEWKQRRFEREMLEQQHKEECEEEHRRREEELQERNLKEDRQEYQMNTFLQLAMTGMMAYMGVKLPKNDDDSDNRKPPGHP
jgi:hypothetical protein